MKIYTTYYIRPAKKWQACSVNTNTERHLLLGYTYTVGNGSDLIIKLFKNVTNHQKLMYLQQWTDLDMYMYSIRNI